MSEDDNPSAHLAWAKQRALEYVDDGDLITGVASFISDLTKHPHWRQDQRAFMETMKEGIELAALEPPHIVRKWIKEYGT